MGITFWRLLIILLIVVLLFGTRRLRSLGSDLGAAISGLRKSLKDEETPVPTAALRQEHRENT